MKLKIIGGVGMTNYQKNQKDEYWIDSEVKE